MFYEVVLGKMLQSEKNAKTDIYADYLCAANVGNNTLKLDSLKLDVCRQLLSDSTSQWTPLLLAIRFPLLGFVRDLHPLE